MAAAFAQKINYRWCANAAATTYRLRGLANERNEALAEWSEVEPALADPRRGSGRLDADLTVPCTGYLTRELVATG